MSGTHRNLENSGTAEYQENFKSWVSLGTGNQVNFRIWVPMCTRYRPEKNFWVPGTGQIFNYADLCHRFKFVKALVDFQNLEKTAKNREALCKNYSRKQHKSFQNTDCSLLIHTLFFLKSFSYPIYQIFTINKVEINRVLGMNRGVPNLKRYMFLKFKQFSFL